MEHNAAASAATFDHLRVLPRARPSQFFLQSSPPSRADLNVRHTKMQSDQQLRQLEITRVVRIHHDATQNAPTPFSSSLRVPSAERLYYWPTPTTHPLAAQHTGTPKLTSISLRSASFVCDVSSQARRACTRVQSEL